MQPHTRFDGFPRSLLVSVDLRAGRVHLEGDLDRTCAHHLLDALAALGLTPHPVWRVDTAGISFCDVAGVRALARAAVLAYGRGRTVRVEGSSPFLTHLLDLTGLAHLVAADDLRHPVAAEGPRVARRRCVTPA
ncbi:STAS domain-containing protein [Geodermatophilus sp. SYSU D01105]